MSHHGYLTGWATFQILSQIIVLALKIKKTKLLFDFIFTLEQKSLFLPAYKNQRVLCIKYLFCPLDVSYGPVHHGHTAARLFVANENKTESRTSGCRGGLNIHTWVLSSFPLISSWSNMKKKSNSSLWHLTVSSGLRKQKLTSALKRFVCRNHKVNWWHAACSECWWSAGRWRAIVGVSLWERIPLWVGKLGFTYIHRWKGHRTDWRQAGGNWPERSPSTCSLPRLQVPIIFSVCLYF